MMEGGGGEGCKEEALTFRDEVQVLITHPVRLDYAHGALW